MSRIYIFCEGVTDQIFIGHCLASFCGLKARKELNKKTSKITIEIGEVCEVIDIGGCTMITNEVYLDKMRDNVEEGGKNLIVFDADFPANESNGNKKVGNNGYENAKKKLLQIKDQHNVEFDFFLWHNNREDGQIEHLIKQLIPEKNMQLMMCIQKHASCLSSLEMPIVVPDLKAQISYYIHTMKYKSKAIEMDFTISELWELDCNKNNDLLEFRNFLSLHFEIVPDAHTTSTSMTS